MIHDQTTPQAPRSTDHELTPDEAQEIILRVHEFLI
jgi:hypothetical protein